MTSKYIDKYMLLNVDYNLRNEIHEGETYHCFNNHAGVLFSINFSGTFAKRKFAKDNML